MGKYRIHKTDGTKEEVTGYIEKIITPEEVAKINGKAKIDDSNEFIRDTFGSFFHFWYSEILKEDCNMAYMVRLLYMASYINYDNSMIFDNGKKIKKKDLETILRLSQRETYNTISYLLEKNFIVIDKKTKNVAIDESCIKKGAVDIQKDKIKDLGIARVFNEGIRRLYENFPVNSHKLLGWFIKILPYLSVDYNIVCKNVNESDMELIEPLSWKELRVILNDNEVTFSRNKNRLLKLTVKGECLVGEIKLKSKTLIIINPNLFYKGNKINNMKWLCDVFEELS